MDVLGFIAQRRDGMPHTKEGLAEFAKGAADATIPDYQLSAWLMAAYLNPLSLDEAAWLTEAMAKSGETLDLDGLPKPWIDKHSTGGVGDKTTLALLPILAACGLTVVKMSGRGLGITGGTIDKLASIPGFRTDLTPDEMKAQALEIGLALTGQGPNFAPADKALYALRDATATVESLPLIVASVLSKKMAGGAETIVLDVKCGTGALAKTREEGVALAGMLREVGKRLGLNVRIAMTDMSQPLGSACGNALEVREAVRVVRGDGLNDQEARFDELCRTLAGLTLFACGKADSVAAGRLLADEAIASGAARRKMEQWFERQGATVDVVGNPDALPKSTLRWEVPSPKTGSVATLDAGTVGRAVVALGGGRTSKEDPIDSSVGILLHASVGTAVRVGAPLFTVAAADEESARAAGSSILEGIQIVDAEVGPTPLILAMD